MFAQKKSSRFDYFMYSKHESIKKNSQHFLGMRKINSFTQTYELIDIINSYVCVRKYYYVKYRMIVNTLQQYNYSSITVIVSKILRDKIDFVFVNRKKIFILNSKIDVRASNFVRMHKNVCNTSYRLQAHGFLTTHYACKSVNYLESIGYFNTSQECQLPNKYHNSPCLL